METTTTVQVPPDRLTEVGIAEQIARSAHAGQADHAGSGSLIDHVERVVLLCAGDRARAVAWLHDVLEHTVVDVMALRRAGISPGVIASLRRLTGPHHDYQQHIAQLLASNDRIAIEVRLADLCDRLRPGCPDGLRERYEAALVALSHARVGQHRIHVP